MHEILRRYIREKEMKIERLPRWAETKLPHGFLLYVLGNLRKKVPAAADHLLSSEQCAFNCARYLILHSALFSHMQHIFLSALGGDYELRVKYVCERAFENVSFSVQTTTARLQGLSVSGKK